MTTRKQRFPYTSGQLWQYEYDLYELKQDRNPSKERGGWYIVLLLAEELLLFVSYMEQQNISHFMVWFPVYQPYSRPHIQ